MFLLSRQGGYCAPLLEASAQVALAKGILREEGRSIIMSRAVRALHTLMTSSDTETPSLGLDAEELKMLIEKLLDFIYKNSLWNDGELGYWSLMLLQRCIDQRACLCLFNACRS